MTDLTPRIRAGLREYADSIDATAPVPAAGASEPRWASGRRRWLGPALVAAAVAAIAVVLSPALVPGLPADRSAATDVPARLPREFATYSHFTAPLSGSSIGRIVASYRYGQGDVPWDVPQSVVLASDRDAYRLVDAAHARGSQGHGAPLLLSGDGTKLAIAGADRPEPDIAVLDLPTMVLTRHPIGTGRVATLLAWSPDARYLLYGSAPDDGRMQLDSRTRLMWEGIRGGTPTLLDTDTGERRELTGSGIPASVAEAAFSWDGRLVAVQEGRRGPLVVGPASSMYPPQPEWPTQSLPGKELVLVDPVSGAVVRRVSVPDEYRIAGQQAWSPDGRLIALERDDRSSDGTIPLNRPVWSIRYVDVTGGAAPEVRLGTDEPRMAMMWFLGWRSPDRVVILDAFQGFAIVASNLDGSGPEMLSRVDTQPNDDRHIDSVQLAYLLLPDLVVDEPGWVDRGPWPGWLRLAVGGPLTLALAFAVLTLYRRLRYPRAPTFVPPSGSIEVGRV